MCQVSMMENLNHKERMHMPQVYPKAVMLTHTPDPLTLIYTAYKQCYSKKDVVLVYNDESILKQDKVNLVKKCMESGHHSPLEHVSFTFAVSGISRAASHQLVRHRIASHSQASQRYIKPSTDFDYVVPPTIDKNPELKDEYVKQIHSHMATYEKLTSEENHIAKEDARFLFPNAIATSLVVTMNARSLLNFFELRCCNRAQWEIRDIANQMLTHCQFVLPEVFVGAGPKCIRQGYCSEGAEFTCGKYPTKEEYFNK